MILNGPILRDFNLSEKRSWRKFLLSTNVPMSKGLGLLFVLLKKANKIIFRFVFSYTV